MAEVTRKMVEDSGIDVEELVDLLVRNASAELTTFYYYTILRINLTGHKGEGLKKIVEDARIEDRNHFEALLPRIYELNGELPRNMKDFHDIAGCPPAFLPEGDFDTDDILEILVEAERCAIRQYTKVCQITSGKDPRTYDIAKSILHEEIQHESWFSEFLGEGPSGHFQRSGDTSPFVSKFLE